MHCFSDYDMISDPDATEPSNYSLMKRREILHKYYHIVVGDSNMLQWGPSCIELVLPKYLIKARGPP